MTRHRWHRAAALLILAGASIEASAATLHGFVREKDTREPVIMANVWLEGTPIGAATNMKGYYVLPGIPAGTYRICVRYLGFRTLVIEKTLAEGDDAEVNGLLESEALRSEPVTVEAERDRSENEIKPGQIIVDASSLRRIPQLAEPDLFRAVQMLPGVASLSDFSAGLYIRGGSPDQNLILLDQIDVYNPNHMFGFFSTFNADAVKSVELLKGGFPAMYGGRLSSVLNVYNKEGNREQTHGVARLSLVSASATVEGPWKKGSWMVSGRRTYLDAAAELVNKNLPYYFYDGHGRINFDIDRNNLASVSFYFGNDVLDLSEEDEKIRLNWGNRTFSAQWTHLFSPKLFSHFVFAGSRFDSDTQVKLEKVGIGQVNGIDDLSLKGNLCWSPGAGHTMDFGFEGKDLDFHLDYKIVENRYNSRFSGRYGAIFVQDNWRYRNLNILQAGLRAETYSDGGYFRLGPRVSFKRLLSERLDLTASVGRYHQFLNQVVQDGASFADMWFPVDRSFEPGAADHFVLGMNYDNQRTFALSLEAYYKSYDHIAEYRAFRSGDESLENQTAAQNFLSGDGAAWGADLHLRNHIGGFEGWLGYSLGWTRKRVDGFNFGREYFPTYDRRHSVTLVEDYRLARKWRVNTALRYGSGQPYTEAAGRYLAMDPDGTTHSEVLEGKKNACRLPDYFRMDLGLFYDTSVFRLPAEFFVQVINVTNRKNVWFREYDLTQNPAKPDDFTQLPLLPTIGCSVHF